MNVYHQIRRKDCLSHQLWPHFKKGWPDTGRPVHFFWGLGDGQSAKIQECMDKNEEWWFVDTGYLTDQIVRYPSPKIINPPPGIIFSGISHVSPPRIFNLIRV